MTSIAIGQLTITIAFIVTDAMAVEDNEYYFLDSQGCKFDLLT